MQAPTRTRARTHSALQMFKQRMMAVGEMVPAAKGSMVRLKQR